LEKLARAQAGRVVLLKVNTDNVPVIASRYSIQSIPTLILFKDGRESKRVSGAMPAPAIERALGL